MEYILDEHLRLRSRYERRFRDEERKSEEFFLAGDVGDRLMLFSSGDASFEERLFFSGENILRMRKNEYLFFFQHERKKERGFSFGKFFLIDTKPVTDRHMEILAERLLPPYAEVFRFKRVQDEADTASEYLVYMTP